MARYNYNGLLFELPTTQPSAPVGASTLDQPRTPRPYLPGLLTTPIFPAGESQHQWRESALDQPRTPRPYVPELLTSPSTPVAEPPVSPRRSAIDQPRAARPYTPDSPYNPIPPAPIVGAYPVGRSTKTIAANVIHDA
jgi:hypothetical protein